MVSQSRKGFHSKRRSRTPGFSRAWKRKRSGRWKASAAVPCSARTIPLSWY